MTDRRKPLETLFALANNADRADIDRIGIDVDTARAIIADLETLEAAREYTKGNPLGGPATMFDTIANRLRAGEDYDFVLSDYGLRFDTVRDYGLRFDTERLDLLEHMANQPGGLLLHDGSETGRTGLGLRHRTLRGAIDAISKTSPHIQPHNPPAQTPAGVLP